MDITSPENHLAIMARMVFKAPDSKLGRTQLMKLCYFLQELEEVPIRYDFRLFNYGPFDPEVLSDLGTACSRNALKEQTVIYNRGYGYQITLGDAGEQLSMELEKSNRELASRVDRVVQSFGGDGAGELELKSTILFVDREFHRAGKTSSVGEVAERVRSIKPHFPPDVIRDRVQAMKAKGNLSSLPD